MKTNSSTPLTGRLKWVEHIAALMDDRFRIPGTQFRFGLDPILNLIPFAGDVSGFVVAAALVWVMARHGVSRKVLILMAVSICLDALIGAIPLVGQISDFYFKANTRNIKLLKEHYEEGRHQGSGTGVLILIFLLLFAFFALFIFLLYHVALWVKSWF
ncbi:DUF4112 domain-containing protein [Mucilaginibacter robiniae]|uniref:DUF4112 domain-containing protein n=1 Tax=Mucilaginibacter robiniae TaxID=2728022 RepID=A0A7L5E1M9_9SPHI|nr:DUF4112 domain-containing protein [Mucilaginibacter robiniae]QJD96418.1 DUF4112 domain-containing protein [Mucilaginibacter robiniae]